MKKRTPYIKRDLQIRPEGDLHTSKETYKHQKRPTKETHKHEKRHAKETYVHYKRPRETFVCQIL